MSGFRGHLLAGGIVFAVLTALFFYSVFNLSLLELAIAFFVSLLFCLLPDIDQDLSIINNLFEKTILFLSLVFVLLSVELIKKNFELISGIVLTGKPELLAVPLLFILLLTKFVRHRTWMHSPVFGIIVCLPLFLLGWKLAVFGFSAFLSHLILDGEVTK